MDEPGLPRRYSDDEVQGLIRRALALQERSTLPLASGGHAHGLTLAEVRQIAQEVGIDPRFVDLAATGGPESETEVTAHWLAGGAYRWRTRRSVPGQVAEADRVRLLEEVRAAVGYQGEVRDVYGAMEWSHDDGLGPVVVEVRSRQGHTEIDVSANRSGAAGLLVGLTSGLGGIGLGAITAGAVGLSGPVVLPVVLAAVGGTFLGARGVWKLRSRAWQQRLEALSHRLAGAAGEVARPPSPEGESQKGDSP